MKVVTFTTHPIQYQYPLFECLGRQSGISLDICYYTDFGADGQIDPGFGRKVVWDVVVRPPDYRPLRRLPSGIGLSPWRTASMGAIQHVLRSKPDVVLLHSGFHGGDMTVLAVSRMIGIPVVCRPETLSDRRQDRAFLRARRTVLRRFSGLCAIGTRAHARLIRAGVDPQRIRLSPYTVDVERFAASRQISRSEARVRAGIPPGLPVVLFVGKMTERKRPYDVVTAMGMMSQTARLVIAGSGDLTNRVMAQARQCGVPVTDLGFVNQASLPYVYRSADVLVLPSSWEPWGLVVNEAMACGTPAVCSSGVAAGDDLVLPLGSEFVHPIGDTRALSRSLDSVLRDGDRLELDVVRRIDAWTVTDAVAGLMDTFELAVSARE